MGFFTKLFTAGNSPSSGDFYTFNVRCDRCNEVIEGKVNMSNDLSMDDEGGYHVRKVLIGDGRCFEQIEVILKFDSSRRLRDKQISGGQFVE